MTTGMPLIFLLDGDAAVRESLTFALELEGLAVRGHATGTTLLSDKQLDQARCLVLDGHLPEVQNFDLVRQLRQVLPAVPLILMLNNGTSSFSKRATAAGVAKLIEKPLVDGALLDAIRGLIA